MRDDKSTEGFIPKGLVAGDVRGAIEGSLTIAGVVERSDLHVQHLTVSETGEITNGQAEAELITIEGRASGMVFRAGRLSAGASARISDCTIEMSNPTGCAIDERAHFEGDVKIAVVRSQRSEEKAPEAADSVKDQEEKTSAQEDSSSAKDAPSEQSSYETTGYGKAKKGSGKSKGSSSTDASSEMEDAEAEVDIPLGD